MTTHYVARHSSGMVHLRKSTGSLVYTHAVVGPRANQVQCAGRHDLAVKALAETVGGETAANAVKWLATSVSNDLDALHESAARLRGMAAAA